MVCSTSYLYRWTHQLMPAGNCKTIAYNKSKKRAQKIHQGIVLCWILDGSKKEDDPNTPLFQSDRPLNLCAHSNSRAVQRTRRLN